MNRLLAKLGMSIAVAPVIVGCFGSMIFTGDVPKNGIFLTMVLLGAIFGTVCARVAYDD